MNDIAKDIQEINDIHDINEIIRTAVKHRKEILGRIWDDYYKDRCKEYYLPLREFIKEIAFWNDKWSDKFEDACYLETDIHISGILDICKKFGITQFGTKVPKMICEACACKGCPYLKEHLGYDCQTCRKEMHFRGKEKQSFSGEIKDFSYEGYCDE